MRRALARFLEELNTVFWATLYMFGFAYFVFHILVALARQGGEG